MLSTSDDNRQCLTGRGEEGACVTAAASTSVSTTPCSHYLACSELAFSEDSLPTKYIKEFRVSSLLFQTQGDSVNTFPPSSPVVILTMAD